MSFNARNSDPGTSHLAADDDSAKRKDRATVWAIFKQQGRPLADFQMEQLLGGSNNGKWRKRRSDLSRDGFLIAMGEARNPATGKSQIMWGIPAVPEDQPQLSNAVKQSSFEF